VVAVSLLNAEARQKVLAVEAVRRNFRVPPTAIPE
jgi:hypothetical protein